MKKNILTALCGIGFALHSFGQTAESVAKASNFTMPSSTAFSLLDVNPTTVNRPGFAKDFKLDWVIKDQKLANNIAMEFQPMWLFAYGNTDYTKLSKQSYFGRVLSSFSVSVGTAAKDTIRSLAWGVKVNLYAQRNPIYDTAYIRVVGNFEPNKKLRDRILLDSLRWVRSSDPAIKASLKASIDSMRTLYAADSISYFKKIDKFKESYAKENWNAAAIDLGFGQLFNYLSESFDSLSFRNDGIGVWLCGNFGIGKKVMVSSMVKYTNVAKTNLTTVGANLRYGGLKTSFFVEGLYTYSGTSSLSRYTIAYGGEIKRESYAIQFGLRTDYTKDMKLKKLIPVINLNYMLGN